MRKLAFAAVLCMASGAFAITIDQNAPTNNAYMAAFYQDDLAQSFMQASNSIVGAGIFLQTGIGSSDTITIGLWDALPNAGGNLLRSASAVGTSGTWFDVFWSDYAITPEVTHYLVFTGSDRSLGIAGDIYNGYSRGQVYANSGFGSFPTYDYTFRTWTTVPEPGTMILLGAGVAALAAKRRRK